MQHLDEGTIHAWLDGELAPAERAEAEAHIAECAECAAAVAEARGFIAASSRILTALDSVPGGVLPAASAATRSSPRRASSLHDVSRLDGCGRSARAEHHHGDCDTTGQRYRATSGRCGDARPEGDAGKRGTAGGKGTGNEARWETAGREFRHHRNRGARRNRRSGRGGKRRGMSSPGRLQPPCNHAQLLQPMSQSPWIRPSG